MLVTTNKEVKHCYKYLQIFYFAAMNDQTTYNIAKLHNESHYDHIIQNRLHILLHWRIEIIVTYEIQTMI